MNRYGVDLAALEAEILEDLAQWEPGAWLRPMDVGGRNGSPHSYLLARLVKKGKVERARRNTLANMFGGGNRGSWCYRLKRETNEQDTGSEGGTRARDSF
jgi:hypothetical protein